MPIQNVRIVSEEQQQIEELCVCNLVDRPIWTPFDVADLVASVVQLRGDAVVMHVEQGIVIQFHPESMTRYETV